MPFISTLEFLDRLGKIGTIKWQLFDGCIRGIEVGSNQEHCPITAVVWSLTSKIFRPDMAITAGKGVFNDTRIYRIIGAADDCPGDEAGALLRAQLLRVLGLEETRESLIL